MCVADTQASKLTWAVRATSPVPSLPPLGRVQMALGSQVMISGCPLEGTPTMGWGR